MTDFIMETMLNFVHGKLLFFFYIIHIGRETSWTFSKERVKKRIERVNLKLMFV